MKDNDQAQWLLLSSVVVSFGIVALLLLLNTAMLAGHSSIESVTDFPLNPIRDLRSLSLEQATLIGNESSLLYPDNAARTDDFVKKYDNFTSQIRDLYQRGSAIASVTCQVLPPDVNGHTYAIINIAYYDGNTIYIENQTELLW